VKPTDIPIPEYGGAPIVPSDTLRYFGVVFDRQLHFTEHVKATIQRASKGVSAIKAAASRGAEERHLLMLFRALVLSVIDYALPMIELTSNQMARLEKIQNSALRTVTDCVLSTLALPV
jgi:hypothetical protein